MKRALRQPTFWLMRGWRALARLAARTPRGHPAQPALHGAARALEGRYWRRARTRPVRVRWRAR